jgi:hypothetical protein
LIDGSAFFECTFGNYFRPHLLHVKHERVQRLLDVGLATQLTAKTLKSESLMNLDTFLHLIKESLTSLPLFSLSNLRFLGPEGPTIPLEPRHSEGCEPKSDGEDDPEKGEPSGEGNKLPGPNLESGPLELKRFLIET